MKRIFLFSNYAKGLIVLFVFFVSMQNASAQHAMLTVDCQNPGWLSDQIPLEDQKTLVNLTVTGKVNYDDLDFIAGILLRDKLKHLDLSKAHVIEKDGGSSTSYHGRKNYKYLSYFSMPENDEETKYYTDEKIDTVIINRPGILEMGWIDSKANNLYISEGVDSIRSDRSTFDKVQLPSTVKYLQSRFISYKDTIDINVNWVNYFECSAICSYLKNDTIRLSSGMKRWETCAFKIKDKSVIYIPKSVTYINNSCTEKYGIANQLGGKSLEIHCESAIPPKINCRGDANANVGYNLLTKCVVYVPFGSAKFYKKEDYFGGSHNPWSYATIIEDCTKVTGIELDKTSIDFTEIGQSAQITAVVLPEDANNKNVVWTSSNPSVARVNNGNVICTGFGVAVIFATTEDGEFVATCTVNAQKQIAVTGVYLDKTSIDFTEIGQSIRLMSTVLPENATNKNAKWNSSNTDVAIVTNGNVVCTGYGTAVISVVTDDGKFMATCTVVAKKNVAVTGIELDKSYINFTEIGQSVQITATVLPSDATNKEVKWSSSNPSVAVVSKGKVVCVGFGTSVIMATTEDGEFMASCTVNAAISGIEELTASGNLEIHGGRIYIKNIVSSERIELYDTGGKQILSVLAQNQNYISPQIANGTYILKVGINIYKIKVK